MTVDSAVIPTQWQPAVIERIAPQTPRVTSIFLSAGLTPHVAGQHVDVRLTAPDGYQAQRSYSIASRPGEALIELAIERLEDGEVSAFFHDIAKPGDSIELRGPLGGHFVWRAEDGGPLLLIAGGSGIVPLMSIVRAWSIARSTTPLLLVYSARTWEELIFRDELLVTQARETDFAFVATTTRGARHRSEDLDQRLDALRLREVLTRWGQSPRDVYVCGSNAFVEAVTRSLVVGGLAPGIIRTERFGGNDGGDAGHERSERNA